MRAHSGVQPPGRLACGILTAAAVDGGGRRCAEGWGGVGRGLLAKDEGGRERGGVLDGPVVASIKRGW